MDTKFLAYVINKAIGWSSLRDYGRTNSKWLENYVANTDLHPLRRREALRLIK